MISLLLCVTAVLTWADELPDAPAKISAEHAARLYRIQVYNTYRLDREQYNLRRAMGDELWSAFEKSSQNAERCEDVICWFEAARFASASPVGDELPSLPQFTSEVQLANEVDQQETVPVSTSSPTDKIKLEPTGAATTLDIQLPKTADQVGPTQVFSRLIRSALDVWYGDVPAGSGDAVKTVPQQPTTKATGLPTTPAKPVSSPAHEPGLDAPQTHK